MKTYLTVLLGLIVLGGCNNDSGSDNQGDGKSDTQAYIAPDPGFLRNAGFIAEGGRLDYWRLFQHASNTSYEARADDGVLTIVRTGPEPWGKLSQQFRKADAEALQGKTLAFSAEVRTQFTDEYGSAFEPPGLMVLAKGLRAGAPAMMGTSILVSEKAEIIEGLEETEWQHYAVKFQLPSIEEATFVDLEVAFLMTLGGQMQVRGPALIEVKEPD